MKYYYVIEMNEEFHNILKISTLEKELNENDSSDATSTLGSYLLEHEIYELLESIFEIPSDFDEKNFINELNQLGIQMVPGNF